MDRIAGRAQRAPRWPDKKTPILHRSSGQPADRSTPPFRLVGRAARRAVAAGAAAVHTEATALCRLADVEALVEQVEVEELG